MTRSINSSPPDEKSGLSVELSDAELNELKRAFPGTDLSEAASLVVKAELDRRYRLEKKAGKLAFLLGKKKRD